MTDAEHDLLVRVARLVSDGYPEDTHSAEVSLMRWALEEVENEKAAFIGFYAAAERAVAARS